MLRKKYGVAGTITKTILIKSTELKNTTDQTIKHRRTDPPPQILSYQIRK